MQPGLRLYNLDEEIGEVTNIAEQHPDVVARLQKLAAQMIADIGSGQAGKGVRPPGVKDNPVTLYPTKQKNKPKGSNAKGKPIDWTKIKMGDAFTAASAPQIAGKPFQIHCKVQATTDGVIVAHGGSAIGYALYYKNGEVVFAVRHAASDIARIHSGKLTRNGELQIVAGLDAKGTITLTTGSLNTGAETSGTLSKQPQEDFCVGHDSQNPLDEQAPRKPFGGKILELRVDVGK